MRGARRRALSLIGLIVFASLAAACERDPAPDPNSLAALEAEGPPHTPDCRSWDASAFTGLEPLAGGPHVAAFEQVWQTVGSKHYDPTLACLDWLALRGTYGKQVADAGDDAAAAYAAINEMLALLGQSHLHATPPMTIGKPGRVGGPATVPLAVRWLPKTPKASERAIVVVDEALGGHASGVPRGAIVTTIAGESIEPLVAELAAGVDDPAGHPAMQAFVIGRGIGALLSCPEGGSLALEFLDPTAGDAPRKLDVPCFLPEGERVSLGNLRDLPTRVEHRMLVEEGRPPIGYLAFNLWMLPMVQRVEAGLTELRSQTMQGLIIDLRGNPGGVGAMSIPIARMILREGASLGRLQMREFDQDFRVEGNPDAFAGPVTILIDEGTASTSEIFAMGLRDIGRVTIVGAGPSAGMALPSMIETLPDGGLIQYVVGDYHSDKGKAAEGLGVVPQPLADESRADYVAGRDPVLELALADIRARLATPPTPAPPAP
ncbi:S41 family peptidase [Nannocystaceae bacterium ST9]